jgi:hypothetical protein
MQAEDNMSMESVSTTDSITEMAFGKKKEATDG